MSRSELVKQILSVSNKRRVTSLLATDTDRWNVTEDTGLRSAVLVPFCKFRDKISLIFTVRNMNLSSHRGQVSFPGGHESPGEDYPIETALRECREEIGLSFGREEVFACIGPVPNRKLQKNIAAVIADVGEVKEESLKLNSSEVTEAFFLSLDTILEERNQRYTIFRNFRYFGMPVYLGGPRHIWGLTATILDLVLEMVVPEEMGYRPIRTRHWDRRN